MHEGSPGVRMPAGGGRSRVRLNVVGLTVVGWLASLGRYRVCFCLFIYLFWSTLFYFWWLTVGSLLSLFFFMYIFLSTLFIFWWQCWVISLPLCTYISLLAVGSQLLSFLIYICFVCLSALFHFHYVYDSGGSVFFFSLYFEYVSGDSIVGRFFPVYPFIPVDYSCGSLWMVLVIDSLLSFFIVVIVLVIGSLLLSFIVVIVLVFGSLLIPLFFFYRYGSGSLLVVAGSSFFVQWFWTSFSACYW